MTPKGEPQSLGQIFPSPHDRRARYSKLARELWMWRSRVTADHRLPDLTDVDRALAGAYYGPSEGQEWANPGEGDDE